MEKKRFKGQGLVEFALVLPVLLMILLGIAEAALVIQGHLAVQHAAREAARFAVTYQPPQGACMDLDGDGVLEDGINDAQDGGDSGDLALAKAMDPDGGAPGGGSDGYPYCPSLGLSGPQANLDESEPAYYARRVMLIKMRARQAAAGLRIVDNYSLSLPSKDVFQDHRDDPGFFGVAVWGFPEYDFDCGEDAWADGNDCRDHPGIQGLPVRVLVIHNVEIIDPFYRVIAERVPVQATAEMVNEGVVMGYADKPIPGFTDNPGGDPGGGGEDVYDLGFLYPTYVKNILPGGVSHTFVAKATGKDVEGMKVHFWATNSDPGVEVSLSPPGGKATVVGGMVSITVTNTTSKEGLTTITAWLDVDGGGDMDAGEPTAKAYKEWVKPKEYKLDLSPNDDTNILPGERAHELLAVVTDEDGGAAAGARVNFLISSDPDVGAFSYSGDDPKAAEKTTDGAGHALVTAYGNISGTASIQAWLDYDLDNTWDASEPGDTVTKTWTALGPYITVSQYEVHPLDEVDINVMDHATGTSYRLLWCDVSTSDTVTVTDELTVSVGGDRTVPFVIPLDSEGEYVLETHTGSDGCGGTDLVAQSDRVRVLGARPDLTVTSISMPALICPRTTFTMSAVIENKTSGSVDEAFDVDFYLNPAQQPPQSPVGNMKQWVSSIGPKETVTVNTLMWAETSGQHTVWVRADTSDYVDEEDEGNNVISQTVPVGEVGPIGSANFDAGTDGFTYEDDAFRSTNQPDYASGNHQDGALRVVLGGVDNNTITGMSGGWQWDFSLSTSNDVIVSFRYNVTQSSEYESDECSQALMSVDGTLHGSGSNDYVDQICGNGNGGYSRTTGWQTFTVNVGTLSAGSHTLVIGGYNNEKTNGDEWTEVLIDDVSVSVNNPPCEEGNDPPPWGDDKPPGLKVCRQLLEVPGFEGNADTVYEHWYAGEPNAFLRQSFQAYGGSKMSMRLHDSLFNDVNPDPALNCKRVLAPFLYQEVTIPDLTEGYTNTKTSLVARGHYLVADSTFACSVPNAADGDDELWARLLDADGDPLAGDPNRRITTGTPEAEASLGFPLQYSGTRGRKGLLASVNPIPGLSVNAQSQIIDIAGFETGWEGWTATPNGGSIDREAVAAHSGNMGVHAHQHGEPTLEKGIDTRGFESISIEYWERTRNASWRDWFRAEWSHDGGATWATLERVTRNRDWTKKTFDLPPWADDNPSLRVRFTFHGDDGGSSDYDDFDLDDILITGVPMSSDCRTYTSSDVGKSIPDQGSVSSQLSVADVCAMGDVNLDVDVAHGYVGDLSFTLSHQGTSVTVIDRPGYSGSGYGCSRDDILATLDDEASSSVEDQCTSSPRAIYGRFTPDPGSLSSFDGKNGSGAWTLQISDAGATAGGGTLNGWRLKICCTLPTVDFSNAAYSVDEDGGSATITVNLSAVSPLTVTVGYTATGGTATAGVDYVPISGTLTFAPGETTKTFQVQIIDDTTVNEGDETVGLELGGASNAHVGPNSPATLTIVENDVVRVDFSSAEYSVAEDAGTATITATLTVSVASVETVTVEYRTIDGSAKATQDYTETVGTLVFAPGETIKTFQVPIIDDILYEGDETVTLELRNPVNADVGPPATLTIVENEPTIVKIWRPFSVDFSNDVTGGVESLFGQEVQLYFYATNDADKYGTWFYLDELEFEVCTQWNIPDYPAAGKGAVIGEIRVLVGGIPKTLQGVDVWAYSQETAEFHHTYTIHDGSFLFHDLAPGTYTIYSEIWIGGQLRFAMTTIGVGEGEVETVNLFLL